METKFQILDCDYFMNGVKPVLRLQGKTVEGKTVCAFYENFDPFFYVLPVDYEKGTLAGFEEFLKKNFGSMLKNVEVVKRFLPIGYQHEKTDILKIVLNDPSKVPLIRSALETDPSVKKFVKQIFEADILFKYRFLSDMGISGLGTVIATGTPATTGTIKSNIKMTATKLEPSKDEINTDLKHMAIDIEVVSSQEGLPDARHDPIVMISMAFHPKHLHHDSMVLMTKNVKTSDDSIKCFGSEKDMLKEFVRVTDAFDPDVVIGYNINGFDLPYITERFKQCGIPCTIGRCNMKPATCKKLGLRYRNNIPGRAIADAYDIIKDSVSKGMMRLKRYGLGDVSKHLLNEDKVDIAHSEISKYWDGDCEQMEKLIAYSRKDSVLAMRLVIEKNMLDKYLALCKVSGILLQDVLSGGESIRVENLLLREFNKEGYVVPCKPSNEEILRRNMEREKAGLKGAIVLEPESGLHTKCVTYLDFKSMYPSIYISYNICPTTILRGDADTKFGKDVKDTEVLTPYGTKFVAKNVKVGIIPRIVEYLISERDKVKKAMKSEKDKAKTREMDSKQLALKVMSNAFYGYTGYAQAKLYLLDIANAITSCGRYLIQTTVETVEGTGKYKVIYGDTDSIMVKIDTTEPDEAQRQGKEIEKLINEKLAGIVSIKIEGVFKTILILTKKRYAGWLFEKGQDGWEDKLITKGIETVRRDWCDLVGDTLFRVLEIILKEQEPKKAFEYVRGIMKKMQNNEIPVERLLITKSISRPIKSYKGVQPHVELVKKMRKRNPGEAPGIGDRVGFVIIQGTQLLSYRAEDPDYVKEHNIKIDSKYYIENQLLPPLERVFEAMGLNKSELLGTGRQMLLSNIFGKPSSSSGDSGNKNGPSVSSVKSDTAAAELPIDGVEGMTCEKCRRIYERPPLVGRCATCGGSIVFFNANGIFGRTATVATDG
jgi:DNA polymerase, archaea type